MKPSEFYQRAASDPVFRHAELDNLRYYRQVGTGLMWFCGAIGAAAWLHDGLTGRGWTSGTGLIEVVALMAVVRASCAIRMRRLENLETEREPGDDAVPCPTQGNARLR